MSAIQYDGATGTIVAFGDFEQAPDGLMLGYVYDDAPLAEPGTKTLVLGRVEVTPPPPPPPPTAAAIAAAQQDAADRATVAGALAPLLADADALEGAGALTAAQLARTDRALVALARTLRRQGLI